MRALGYAEVALVVANAERSARFYIDVVGYEMADFDVGEGARVIKVGPDHFMGLWEPNVWGSNRLPFEGAYGADFRRQVGQAHLVFAICTTVYILIAIQFEERDLIDALGQDYVEYKRRVPMLVPGTVRTTGSERALGSSS